MVEPLAWVNPYRYLVGSFPGRLFEEREGETSLNACKELINRESESYLEIGSGSGGHLLELAARNRNAAFLGCEVRYKRAVRTIEKATASDLQNVFIFRGEISKLIPAIPHNRLAGVYVNFPDPWAKRRDWKHRTLALPFLEAGTTLLRKSGFISVKTDHAEYFHFFMKHVRDHNRYMIDEISEDLYESPYLQRNIQTEFERLFVSQGKSIHYVKLRLLELTSRDSEKGI